MGKGPPNAAGIWFEPRDVEYRDRERADQPEGTVLGERAVSSESTEQPERAEELERTDDQKRAGRGNRSL